MRSTEPPEPVRRLRDGRVVGGWLLKASPTVWDLPAFLAAGGRLDHWRLTDSYRLDLVAPGDRCVLWMTGPHGATPTPGLWALGTIRGRPELRGEGDDDGFWETETERRKPRAIVPIRLRVLKEPIPRRAFVDDPRFADAEIRRAPRVGNPVALTPDELAVIDEIVDDHRPRRRPNRRVAPRERRGGTGRR
jgi:hypothetical protein